MKIAFYTTSFFPYISGISTSILNLSMGLLKSGHQVILCVPKAKCLVLKSLEKKGIKIIFLPSFRTSIYKDFNVGAPSAKSFLLVRELNPDLIHFHTPELVGLEAILTAKILKKPLVGTFHTYYMSSEYQKIFTQRPVGEEFIEKILWRYNNSIYNRCDLVIAPSKATQIDLIKNGIKKPVKIVHNSVDLEALAGKINYSPTDLKEKYNLSDKTILYVGRVSREKSIDLLILALNVVIRKVPSAKLLIIGDGPVRMELMALMSALNLQNNVVFTGEIDNEKLIKMGFYKLATVFATASTSEVQPMSALEAIANGLPVVGVKMRGMSELIKNNGIICKPGDVGEISQALTKILTDNSLQKRFALQSLKLAQKEYALSTVTREIEVLYQNLIKSS